jgi:hypothetical protein
MTEAVLYLDTNAFLQLRDLKDLPWSELVPEASAFVLTVARAVVDELDGHKTGTSGRRRDRARAALRLVDAASDAPDRRLTIREGPVEVVLAIAPRGRIDWDALGLDPAEPDDRIVAAVAAHPGAALVSHDSGPRISARDIGVTAYAPPEHWLLKPERSDEQRRLAEADRRIAALLDARPNVEIAFEGVDAEGILVAWRFEPRPLTEAEVRRLTDAHVAEHPMTDLPSPRNPATDDLMRLYGGGLSSFDISQYSSDYRSFIEETRRWFAGLHKLIAARSFVRPAPIVISNVGQTSAARLVVEWRAFDGASLLAGDDAAGTLFGQLAPPSPPKEPTPRNAAAFLGQPAFDHLRTLDPSRRDPTAFTWMDRPTYGATSATYGCQDFRPGRVHHDDLPVVPDDDDPSSCRITASVSADDMPVRTASAEIRFETMEADWDEEAMLTGLPGPLRRMLGQAGG